MASIAIAVWIFLFGSGKYKSWGVMQRYVLQTSPNSKRYQGPKPKGPPKTFLGVAKRFIQKQLLRLDSSADEDLDHVPLKTSAQDRRRASTRYSTAINIDPATMNTAAAIGPKNGGRTTATSYHHGGGYGEGGPKEEFDPSMARYSVDSTAFNNFYFTEQGTPRTRALQPLAPIGEEDDDSEAQVNEMIQLMDLRIDERMWSLERTLARYYLDGFRLRNYSPYHNPYQGGDDDLQDMEQLQHLQEPKNESGGRGEGVGPSSFGGPDSRNSGVELLQTDRPYSGTYSPPSSGPSIPPRPKLTHQYHVNDNGSAINRGPGDGSNTTMVGGVPAGALNRPTSGKHSFNSEISASGGTPGAMGHDSSESGFPSRRNMRGTIRRAVERLQNEWPQNQPPQPHTPQPYMPRTQYQGGETPGNNSNPLPPPPPPPQY